jgi:uracil phosphoribosyltransferase
VENLLKMISLDKIGGETFRKTIYSLGVICGKVIKKRIEIPNANNSSIIIGIPRGGIPFANGIGSTISNSKVIFSNDGVNKISDQPLLLKNIFTEINSTVILADPIVNSGLTVEKTLEIIYKNPNVKTVIMASIMDTPDGAHRLENMFPKLYHYTFSIETDLSWIAITERIKQRRITRIGDVGDLVSKGL